MSESTKPPPAKRLRWTDETEQPPLDVTEPVNLFLDSAGDKRPLLASRPESSDIQSFLLGLIQTDAGANDLANALKDRHIRDVLKEHGLNIRAADDVGYNSLPLELRDQIREHVIADLVQDGGTSTRRNCCPRLSAYACIDAEWQAAVEAVTFRTLYLIIDDIEPLKDLDSFTRHVGGNRPHYVQFIQLPCTVKTPGRARGICEDSIRRLFRCMNQWREVATRDRDLHLELVPIETWGWSMPWNISENQLSDIPVTSRVTMLSVSDPQGFDEEISAQDFLGLVSRLPQLKHITIERPGLDFWSSEIEDGEDEDPSFLFDRLSQNAPKLESLHISVEPVEHLCAEYRGAIMSFSKKLSELHLMDMSREALLDCLSPFCAVNFDSLAACPLSWPSLTTLNMGTVLELHDNRNDAVKDMSELMLPIAGAVRHMPLIQSLKFKMEYRHPASDGGGHLSYMIFELSVFRDNALDGLRAVLSITQDRSDPELNFAEALASETTKELWRESLLRGANAVLDFDVGCKEH